MRNTAMNTAKDIERAVASLSQSEFAEFRAWFADFDFDNWDTQIEMDIAARRLEGLGDNTLKYHQSRKTKEM